jgi:hypothetical protein
MPKTRTVNAIYRGMNGHGYFSWEGEGGNLGTLSTIGHLLELSELQAGDAVAMKWEMNGEAPSSSDILLSIKKRT